MSSDKQKPEGQGFVDGEDVVGMNVEIAEDLQPNQVVVYENVEERPIVRYLQDLESSIGGDLEEINNEGVMSSAVSNIYLSIGEYCTGHDHHLLLEDETLVKPGDKFTSHDVFVDYLNDNAKRWCYYYKCSESHKPDTDQESYTYSCGFLRKEKNRKNVKKRSIMRTDCPCKIKLIHLPNEKELTVVYVCNHHNHDLSLEEFTRLQHGKRIPPYVKEEIKDLIALQVDITKIKNYVQMETGFDLSRAYFYGLEKSMKSKDTKRFLTEERLEMLREKMSAVDELYGLNDDMREDLLNFNQDCGVDAETRKKMNPLRLYRNKSNTKKRTKPLNKIIITDDFKRIKHENEEETLSGSKQWKSTKISNLSEWVSDQCVPVQPNRTPVKTEREYSEEADPKETSNTHSENHNESEDMKLQYYNDTNTTDNSQDADHNDEANDTTENNVVYQTVVKNDNEGDGQGPSQIQIPNDILRYIVDQSENPENSDLSNTQYTIELDNSCLQYMTGDNSNVIGYINEKGELSTTNDVSVDNKDGKPLLPVFDVQMKDGNVTGFVVNNSAGEISGAVDKEVQTMTELELSEPPCEENEDDVIFVTNSKTGDTYTKHEYIHKYNIDKYMTQPHFPKYVETLAKETHENVLHMFTNIYTEKAMFKMVTTHKGKEGNTRIWYLKDIPKFKRRKPDDVRKAKLGRELRSCFIMKEKIKMLKRKNNELLTRNKYLEEVAFRLVKLGNRN